MKYKKRKTTQTKERSYSNAINTELLSKKNVNSYFISKKIINNKKTNIDCLTIGVSKKQKKEDLDSKDLIPSFYKGLSTDVIESQIPVADSLSSSNFCGEDCGSYCTPPQKYPYGCTGHQLDSSGEYYNCIPGGVSIGIKGAGTGSLGFNAVNFSGESVGVTNNHVLGQHFFHPSTQPTIKFEVFFENSKWKFVLLNPTRDIINSVGHDLKKQWIADSLNSENPFSLDDTGMVFHNPKFDGFISPMLEGERHYQFTNKSDVETNADFSFRYDFLDSVAYNKAVDDWITGGMHTIFPDGINYKQVTNNLRIFESSNGFMREAYKKFNGAGGYTEYGKNSRVAQVAYPGETYDVVFDSSNFHFSRVHYYSYKKTSSSEFVDVLFYGRGCVKGKDAEGDNLHLNQHGNRLAYYPSENDSQDPSGPQANLPATPTSTIATSKGPKLIGSTYLYPMLATHSINEAAWNHKHQPSNILDVGYIRYQHAVPLVDIVGIPDYEPRLFTEAWSGMPLIKSGRSTGVSSNGFIESTNWTGYITYCGGEEVLMTDCLQYGSSDDTYFTSSGDSGSALLSDVTKGVTALNFAGSHGNTPSRGGFSYTGFGIKIENIVDVLGISTFSNSLIYEASTVINEAGNLKDVEEIGHCGITYKKAVDKDPSVAALEHKTSNPIIWYVRPGLTPTATPPTGTFTSTPTQTVTPERSFDSERTPTPTLTPPTGTFTPTLTATPPTGTFTATPTATPLNVID